MKKIIFAAAMFIFVATQLHAANEEKPESITNKMAIKLGKGITNIVTSPLELPKQTVLMTKDYGFPGFLVGPFSGVIMTGYRAFIGATETALFMVPAPEYYDNMIDPEFVWVGWSRKSKPSQITMANSDDEQP